MTDEQTRKLEAEIAALINEAGKLQAETAHLNEIARSGKLQAEADNLNARTRFFGVTVAATIIGAFGTLIVASAAVIKLVM